MVGTGRFELPMTTSLWPPIAPSEAPMRIGFYARVSTTYGQNPEVRLAELREHASLRRWLGLAFVSLRDSLDISTPSGRPSFRSWVICKSLYRTWKSLRNIFRRQCKMERKLTGRVRKGDSMQHALHSAGRWTGKVVLITGASDGIDASCARLFTQRGAKLVLTALPAEGFSDEESGSRLVIPGDITQKKPGSRWSSERLTVSDALMC